MTRKKEKVIVVKDKPDLALVSLDDLLNEVNERFEHWIFCGMQVGVQGDKILTTRKWRGNYATCMGLAGQMGIAVYDTYMEKETPGHPD